MRKWDSLWVLSLWAFSWGDSHTRVSTPDFARIRLLVVVGTSSEEHLADVHRGARRGAAPPGDTMRIRFPPRGALAALPLLLLLSLPLASSDDSPPPPSSSSSSARARERHREARAKLERAFAHVFPSGIGDGGSGDDRIDPGSTVYTLPPGRIGAIGDPHARDLAFERWVLEPPPADDGMDHPAPAPEVGPLKLRAVWGRGRGLVTTRPVEPGETLMRVPLMKCLSTASARRSAVAPALAEISSPRVTVEAVVALHLLHELYVQGAASPWWPYVSILPADVGSPVMWEPRELAQLEGSNVIGFRDEVLRGWTEQRDALFPALTERYPELFPEQHFRASRWVWAMSTVWSRAAHVPAGNGRTLLAMVPLFDMFNHGYDRGDGSSSPAAIETRWDPTSGTIAVRSTFGFPGPGHEARFNYGDKPSQYALLQYGFVPMNNPGECVEVALHLPKRDALRARKSALLTKHDLSPKERNFHFYPRRLDPDLLAATRIQMMTEAELDDPGAEAAAVAGAPVGARNEAKTRAMLLKAAYDMLARYPTTLWEDKRQIEAFAAAHPRDEAEAEGEAATDASVETPSARTRLAVMMRVREKTTLLAAARLILDELSDELSDEICEERYPAAETEPCVRRASGRAFDVFERAPAAEEAGERRAEADGGGSGDGGRFGDGVGDVDRDEL